jgi:hypothetical protein
MRKIVAAILLTLGVLPSLAFGQGDASPVTWDQLQRLRVDTQVRVTLIGGTEIEGRLVRATPESVIVNGQYVSKGIPGQMRGQLTVSRTSVSMVEAASREVARLAAFRVDTSPPSAPRSWAGRHPVLLGALIGAGVFTGIGAAMCSSSCEISAGQFAAFPAGGAGLGALVGLTVSISQR